MSIQILSDLHLEVFDAYDDFTITPRASYLALIGDIGNIKRHGEKLKRFLHRQMAQFQAVLFVAGNHEAYHGTWEATLAFLQDIERASSVDPSAGRFIFMDRQSFTIPDTNITVLGCSLFSSIPPEKGELTEMRVNDFMQTEDWTYKKHNSCHARDLKWLNSQLEAIPVEADSSILILTHWSPSTHESAVDPRHSNSSIGCAFATDLQNERCYQDARVKIWAFGHTHFNCDFQVMRSNNMPLRLLANQYGYYFAQSENFDSEKRILLTGNT